MCMALFSAWDRSGGNFLKNMLVFVVSSRPPTLPSFSAAVALPALGENRGKDQGRFEATFFPKKTYVPET